MFLMRNNQIKELFRGIILDYGHECTNVFLFDGYRINRHIIHLLFKICTVANRLLAPG